MTDEKPALVTKDKAEPTSDSDRQQLAEQNAAVRDRGSRASKVVKDPADAQKNDVDWLAGRDPDTVVEVEGQRETAADRMRRNGVTRA